MYNIIFIGTVKESKANWFGVMLRWNWSIGNVITEEIKRRINGEDKGIQLLMISIKEAHLREWNVYMEYSKVKVHVQIVDLEPVTR